MSLLYNPATQAELQRFHTAPSHAVLLTGPTGAGKRAVADELIASLLGRSVDSLESFPYLHVVSSDKAVSIEEIRAVEQFLRLRVPGTKAVNRVVLVERADTMGHEAQNAFLKTLEEPPLGTIIILLATNSQSLLPTVQSRLQRIAIKPISPVALSDYFLAAGHSQAHITQASAVSGGLPGLMQALLADSDHPLVAAIATARTLLQETTYQRLIRVDELAKQKSHAQDTLFILQQMAHSRLASVNGTAAERWQQVLQASYTAAEQLRAQVQPKLVLDQLMLDLG